MSSTSAPLDRTIPTRSSSSDKRVEERLQIADRPGPARGRRRSSCTRWNGRTDRRSEPASTTNVSRRSHGPGPDAARISSRIRQRRRVTMVPVGDQERLLGQPVGDRRVRRDRPAAMRSRPCSSTSSASGGDAVTSSSRSLERGARAAHGAVDGGEMRVRGAEQPEAILDRSRHGLLVGDDFAAPVLAAPWRRRPRAPARSAIGAHLVCDGTRVASGRGPPRRPTVVGAFPRVQ